MRKLIIGFLVLLIVALTGGILYAVWRRDRSSDSSPHAASTTQPVRVRVVHLQSGGVERTVTRPGTVHAYQFAQLYTKVSGFLRNQKVDIGSRVEKGQVLAEIYAPEYMADVRKAESDLQKAHSQVAVMQARLEAARADQKQAQAKIGQAEADLDSARATVVLRKQQYQRYFELAKMRSVEQELVDEKLAARRSAEADERSSDKAVLTAKAGLTAAQANVTRAEADLDDAQAQVKVAEAILSRARIWEAYTRIVAPYTGVVTQRGYHDGEFICAGSTAGSDAPVLTVARTDLMRLVVWVPDPDVPYVRPGARATFRVSSMPEQIFQGKVARTADAENPNTRSMRTEVDLPNTTGKLKQGMFGRLTIELGKSRRGETIPSDCLFGPEKEGKRSVYVVRNGKALQVAVLVGQDDGVRAEVLEGLQPQDAVIEQHDPGLASGVAVEVTAANTADLARH